MKGKKKRVLASLLAVLMVVGLLPFSLFGNVVQANAEVASSGDATDCVAEGTINFKNTNIADGVTGISVTSIEDSGSGHGLQTKAAGATMVLNLESNAKIVVETCRYGAGANGTMTASSGTVESSTVAEGDSTAPVFTVTGASGETTLTFATNMYIHNVVVTYETEPEMVAEGTINFKNTNIADGVKGVSVTSIVDSGSGHGLQTKAAGATMVLNLESNAKIVVETCRYGAGANGTMTASSGTVESSTVAEGDSTAPVFTVTGASGETTLTFATNMYIHSIAVEYLPASDEKIDEANNFRVWLDELAADGTVATGTHEYGGGNVTLVGKDATQFTVLSDAENVVRDGETHNGYKAGDRHATANDIPSIPKAGDGCCVEFESKATGMFKMYFWSSSFLRVWEFDTATGERIGYTDSEVAADFYAFKTVPGHTYVMSTTGKTNKMAYVGYEFIQNMDVEVPVEFSNAGADANAVNSMKITITDAALGTEAASVTKDTKAVTLLKNHTYVFESSDGGVRAAVSDKDSFVATGDKVTFELYDVPNVELTGDITGTPEGTVTGLKFVNMVNGSTFAATINGSSYSCSMKPGEYNTVVETTNGGKTYDRVSVKADGANVNEVYVEVVNPAKATKYGPSDIAGLEITGNAGYRSTDGDFTGKEGATIKVPVSGKANVVIETYYEASYKVNGTEYTNTTKSTSANQADSMVVDGDFVIEVTGGVGTTYFKGISVTPIVEFKDTISVPEDYATLNEAFSAISGMEGRPEGEAGRVTVELNCDIFEQTVVNAPYVTLKGNGHTVSWYYGVGTLYYSVDPSTGLYNERLARDKYSSAEGNGNLWGGAFIVRGNNFIAEDTTFKNTYNYELTDAEKSDIAGSTLSVSRLADGANVAAYAYKERSNAFYIEADNIECYNCKILSSQDTLGRNGSANNGYHVYFKDCVIGGNVDYICGEFAAVFDNCELQWKTYAGDTGSNNGKIGYIVAPKTSPYVFRNCIVTLDDENAPGVAGFYGRTWGANSNAVFINTETNGYIKADGWGEMSSGEGASAVFKEYNNTSNGEAFVSTGTSSDNQTLDAVKDYIDTEDVSIVATLLNNWTPVHYAYEITKSSLEVIPDEESAVTAIETVGTVEFVDLSGKSVTGDIIISSEKLTEAPSDDIKAKVDEIIGSVEADVFYYDIKAYVGSISSENIVQLDSGAVKIKFGYPENVTEQNEIIVLHMTVEIPVDKEDGGFWITADGFSPYTVIIKAVPQQAVEEDDDDDDSSESATAPAENPTTQEPVENPTETPSEQAPDTSKPAPDTADVAPLTLMAVLALVSSMGIAASYKKRYN